MALSAAAVTAMASSLRSAASAHGSHALALGAALTAIGTAVDGVRPMWRGPSTDTAMAAAQTFLGDVADLPAVIEDAQAILADMATFADGVAAALGSAEATLARLSDQRARGVVLPDEAIDRAIAQSRITAAEEDWTRRCGWASSSLGAVGNRLRALSAEVAMGPPYPATPQGTAYAVALAQFSVANGIPMRVLDPRGETKAATDALLDSLATTANGQLVWLLIETADEGDLMDRDGEASSADLEAAMDPTRARQLIARYEEITGVQIAGDAKVALAAQIIGAAALLKASDHVDLDDLHVDYPAPGATDPNDASYRDLVRWLTTGTRGSLVANVANPDADQWAAMVESGSQTRFNAALAYFDVAPQPGAGVVVTDFFIPSNNAFVLAGDDRSHEDPVFGPLTVHDSRIVIVLDLEQGRGSVLIDDSELALVEDAWHQAAHPIDLDNRANPYDPRNDRSDADLLQTILPITNTLAVDSFRNQVTVGWDGVNSITPIASTDGVFTLRLGDDRAFDLVDIDADEYPSIGIYHYPIEGPHAGQPVVVHHQDSQGIGYTFPWWSSYTETVVELSPAQDVIDLGTATLELLEGTFSSGEQMAPGPFPGDEGYDETPTTQVVL